MREASTEQIGGGGVSIYYSQILQVLFFSYAQGITFMASLTKIEEEALNQCITQVHVQKPTGTGNTNKNTTSGLQPLCQWGEVSGHPGLILAFLQASNNPVVIFDFILVKRYLEQSICNRNRVISFKIFHKYSKLPHFLNLKLFYFKFSTFSFYI